MRKTTFALATLLGATGCLFLIFQLTPSQHKIQKVPKQKAIEAAIEQEFEMTKDPSLNEVPRDRLIEARAYAERLRQDPDFTRAAITGINWDERGPNNVSGRTRAILVDAADASGNTIWVGSVGGGLWKTTNALATNPSWNPVNDLFDNIAVSSIAQDPSNSSVMYFGTGEGFFNADAIRGLGIWKTTNGGTTWAQLSSTNNSTFHYVQKLLVNANGDVFACTRDGGVQRSTNGGTSWTKVLGSGASATSNRAADIERASNGDLYATTGMFQTDGIYRSTNGGTSWTKLTGGGLPSSGYQRIELACAPSNSARVYAVFQGTNYDCSGIYRTDNSGTSWTSLSVPSAFGMANFCRGQAWYDLICAVDPNNANRVFIGGIDVLVSSNSGASWSQFTQWYGGGGFQYMHADQHAMTFDGSSRLYFGNDGGIARSTNATNSTPTVNGIFNGYNVTQFYAADLSPTSGSNVYLAGAQDNGTQRFTGTGINNTTEVTGGDGAFCHIDQTNGAVQVSSYVYNNYYITTNSWGSQTSRSIGSSAGRFINPTDFDDASNVLYGAYNAGTFSYITGVGSSNTTGSRSISAFAGSQVSSVSVSPNVGNQVYFGLDNGDVVRVSSANTSSASGTVVRAGTGYVSSIAIEEGNENHMLVTYSNYGVNSVYETTNGGGSWTSVEGNLPDMPIRFAMFAPGESDQALLATELGVWSTDNLNGGSTVWGPSNGGLANVRTDMLKARSSDNTVLAATHGRGLYTTDFFAGGTGPSCASTVTSYPYSESFESGIGSWTQSGSDDIDWTRDSGGTPSSGTGPTTGAAGSWYMYIEASSPNYPSKTAIFESACFNLSSLTSPELNFAYHMQGSAVGTVSLQLSTDDGGTWPTTLWTQSGDQGAAWNPATIDLSAYASSTIKLRYFGTTAASWQGDIAIDDFSIAEGSTGTTCTSTITSFPYSQSFESGLGQWSQASGDDTDWTRDSGGTPSTATGPTTGADGSWYMYIESSSPNYPSKVGNFNGPCFDLSSLTDPEFNFQYHMYGATMGTLNLQASTDGSTWTTLWTLSGNQGNSWQAASVSMASYAGSTVQLRFNGITGTSYTSDITVDALSLDEAGGAGCPSIDFNSYTINSYGGTQDAGSSAIQDAGATLLLQNNAWKSITYNYTVTANTVVEFDFRSTLQGEIHGIAFDNDNAISSNLTFKVHGTQNWGFTDYDNYSPTGWTTYVIPVGSFYTGSFNRLCFVADHDASPSNGNAYFRNVKVYEGSCSGNVPVLPTAGLVPQLQTDAGPLQVNAYPNPFRNSFTLATSGAEGEVEDVQLSLFNSLGQKVFSQDHVPTQSEIQVPAQLSAGVYILRIRSDGYVSEQKLIKTE
ncbi:MAG: T9SS type A sorting domain-containing protein [Bacteroidia bacterium]